MLAVFFDPNERGRERLVKQIRVYLDCFSYLNMIILLVSIIELLLSLI